MNNYSPTFECQHCGQSLMDYDRGFVRTCDCKEARETWERKHREDMELRKSRIKGRTR